MNRRLILLLPAVALVALAGCSSSTSDPGASGSATATPGSATVTVTSTGSACDLSAKTATAGEVTFQVSNQGSDVTEFYLYQEDGTTIVGEVEDVTPGLTRDMAVEVVAGSYVAACKPTSDSEGIRTEFTVS